MQYIFKSRGLGKTSDIVKLCYENKGTLLVDTLAHKKYIKDYLCKSMNINPQELSVFTISEFNKYHHQISPETPLYIDEFQCVLEMILKYKVNAIAGTLD